MLHRLTCRMRSHSVICHLAEMIFPPLPQSIKAGSWFSDPGGMQGWVDLVGWLYIKMVYHPSQSPTPLLTGLDVE